jgi:hypothetical protein
MASLPCVGSSSRSRSRPRVGLGPATPVTPDPAQRVRRTARMAQRQHLRDAAARGPRRRSAPPGARRGSVASTRTDRRRRATSAASTGRSISTTRSRSWALRCRSYRVRRRSVRAWPRCSGCVRSVVRSRAMRSARRRLSMVHVPAEVGVRARRAARAIRDRRLEPAGNGSRRHDHERAGPATTIMPA